MLVLERADRVQVIEDVVGRLDVAVHHRGGRPEAPAVGLAVDAPARLRARPSWARCAVRTRSESTSAPPPGSVRWPASQRRSSTSVDREARRPAPWCWISEAVKKCGVTCGKRRARLADEGEVVVEGQGGVVAALEQHRRGALRRGELDLRQHLVDGEGPGFRVARLAVEGAELAVGDADVRVVRVGVDHERHRAARDSRAKRDFVGERAHLEQRRLGQQPAPRRVEPLAVERLVADLIEPMIEERTACRDAPSADRRRGGHRGPHITDLHHVVEGVALHRDLARVADHPEELLARQAGRRLGAAPCAGCARPRGCR